MAVQTKTAAKGGVKNAPAAKATPVKAQAAPVEPEVQLAENGRKIVYPEVSASVETLDADAWKEIFGWEAEKDFIERETQGMSPEVAKNAKVEFGDFYDFKDYYGEKIRLANNHQNRPMDETWIKELARQQLSGIWQLNGEAVVIGETGLLLSGQHRGLGYLTAWQMLNYDGEDDQKKADAARYQEQWPNGLTMTTVVTRGVKESSLVTRTLDNVKPRSLKDVLFADTDLFKDFTKDQREEVCRIAEYGIRTVRDRTGDDKDAFALGRAQGEHLDFFTRHPRLGKAVKFVVAEMGKKDAEGKKPNAKMMRDLSIGAGSAAGLMFLMGSGGSDWNRWSGADNPSDRFLTFDYTDAEGNVVKDGMWEKAREFWTKLMDPKDKTFDLARKEIKGMDNPNTGQKGPVKAKLAVVVNAWNQWFDGGKMTPGNLAPEYKEVQVGENLVQKLVIPSCGGIDLGDAKAYFNAIEEKEEEERKAQEEAEGGEGGDDEVSPEEVAEVEAAKAQVKQQSLQKKQTEATGKPGGGLRGGTQR